MINITLDPSSVFAGLDKLQADQIPFALSRTINKLGEMAQQSVREGMQRDLDLRREVFELRQIQITRWANKRNLVLTLQINPHAMNLIRLAAGLDHLPWIQFNGHPYQWVPNSDVFQNKIITNANPLAPHNLKFTQHGGDFQGPERTFVLQNKSKGVPLVWQRVASAVAKKSRKKGVIKAKDDSYKNTRLLYRLVDRAHTPAKLQFYGPISRTINHNWAVVIKAEMAHAMAGSKP